jgi:hypothetical protein
MIREGSLPLWNLHRGNGQPFMANPNSLVLRPTTPLFLLFPPERAHIPFTLSVILLLGIAAAGTFGLLRDTGHGRAASLVGASAFALSGVVQSLGQLVNLLEGVAWIPVTLWLLNRAFCRAWRPWAVLAGLAFALVLATGEPILAGITALAAVALPGAASAGVRRLTTAAGVALGVAALVAAIQILPLAELASRSARAGALAPDEVMKWSLAPAALLQTVLPDLWGDPTRAAPQAYWGAGLFDTSLPLLPSLHLGMPILILAAAALPARRRWITLAAAAGVLGALLALGRYTPLYPALVAWVPGAAKTRYTVKWFILAAWCASLLCAAGFQRLLASAGKGRGRSRAILPLAGVLGGVMVGGLALWWRGGAFMVPWLRSLLRIPERLPDEIVRASAVPSIGGGAALGAGASLLILGALFAIPLTPGTRKTLVTTACLVVLLAGAWHLNPTAPPDLIFARSPLLDGIAPESWPERRLFGYPRPRGFGYRTPSPEESGRAGLPADSLAWGMKWDARTLRFVTPYLWGLRAAYDQAGESLLGLRPGAAVARRLKEGLPMDETVRLLRAASVGWVLGYGPLEEDRLSLRGGLPGESNIPVGLYAVTDPLPRAFLVARARLVASADEAIEELRRGRVDPSVTVLVEGAGQGEGAPLMAATARGAGDLPPSGPPGRASVTKEGPTEVVVRFSAERPAWLVLTDTFDPGWKAELDGTAVAIHRANGMFRSLVVPAGTHEVRFVYRPTSVLAGMSLSVLGLVAATTLLVAGRHGPARDAPTGASRPG